MNPLTQLSKNDYYFRMEQVLRVVLRTKNKVSAKFVCRCHVPCALHLHAANELISLRMYVYSSIRATTTAGIWRNVRK